MQLKAGQEAEYQKRHDAIWPELAKLLKDSGISEYSIYLHEATGQLFGVMQVADTVAVDTLPAQPVMQRWWKYMSDIMEANEDFSPVSIKLNEVFYLP